METNRIKYFIWVYMAIGCAGCNADLEVPAPVEREVVFRIEQESVLPTKASAMGFALGDSIGVYAVKRNEPGQVALPGQSGNQAHNAKWIKTEEGWQPASLADKIVFPQDGAKLDFYAYYPYNRNGKDPENFLFTVKADQIAENNRKLSDFMVAYNKEGINEGEVNLVFSHALAMVEVAVKAGNQVDLSAGLKVQMAEIQVGTYLNFGTDQLASATAIGTIDMFRVEDAVNKMTYTYRAYVPVQLIPAQTPIFRCLQDGKIYIYRSSEVSLQRGNRTCFELSLRGK